MERTHQNAQKPKKNLIFVNQFSKLTFFLHKHNHFHQHSLVSNQFHELNRPFLNYTITNDSHNKIPQFSPISQIQQLMQHIIIPNLIQLNSRQQILHNFIPQQQKMKTSHTIVRDKIFKDHKFYEPKQSSKPVSTVDYERYQHQKVISEYQTKKVPQYAGYKHASSWNPLNRKYERIDKPYKQLHQRKQRIAKYSNMKSDPFSIHPAKQPYKNPNSTSPRRQFQPSQVYIAEHQRRYLLPKDRQVSQPNKHYHSQIGISQQKLPWFNRKEKDGNMRNSSSSVRLTLDYGLSGRNQGLNRSMEGFGVDY